MKIELTLEEFKKLFVKKTTEALDIDLDFVMKKTNIILAIFMDLEKIWGKVIPEEFLVKEMMNVLNYSKSEADERIDDLKKVGDIYAPKKGYVSRIP